ncbi:hypothetical protein [Legionella waltersii]|uniref:Uncharacterized protein n=1 Tax=Legionella waltersii TaxID=66969 RepID=A0A0W1A4M3_9GAMM|nr:hypothetical protein [Legionella waltersii]KTD76283.1 hypothetical protein Lwal_2005 [Legionella waltersii]SNV13401.1 Uncharacterised protein [Legionella waltersii]
MFNASKFIGFTEVSTFKSGAQTILNLLRKKMTPEIRVSLNELHNGGPRSMFPQEIQLLLSFKEQPEKYIKNLDEQSKKQINEEISAMLDNFVTEINELEGLIQINGRYIS